MSKKDKELEALGEDVVRDKVKRNSYQGSNFVDAVAWLDKRDRLNTEASISEDRALARKANDLADDANRYAKTANTISIASIIITIIGTILSLAVSIMATK